MKLKEPIDLERMHPCGYTEGPPGIVLGLERPGYRTKEKVVRPAGVLIANPVESRAKKTRGGK